jgi:ABC-type lipoprotein export system ATPase subunit
MKIYKKNRFDYFTVPYYYRLEFYIVIVSIFAVISYLLLNIITWLIITIFLIVLISVYIYLYIRNIFKHKGYYLRAVPQERSILISLIDTMQLNSPKGVKRIKVPNVFVDLSYLKNDKKIIVNIERLAGMDDIESLVPLVSNSFKGKYSNYAVTDFVENDNILDFEFILEDVKVNKTLVPKCINELLAKDLYTFKLQRDLNWDISKFPHLICSGATGSGKTTLLFSLLIQCYKRNIETYLIDPKKEFAAFDMTISDTQEVLKLLEQLVEKMEQREYELSIKVTQIGQTAKDLQYKPVMIFIDEVTALVAGFNTNKEQKLFEQLLRKIVLKGRALGYNVLFFAQNFNSETLSVAIRNQPSIRIMLGQNSTEDYKFIFGNNTETITKGHIDKFTGYYIVRGLTNKPQRFFVPNLHEYKLNTIEMLKEIDK